MTSVCSWIVPEMIGKRTSLTSTLPHSPPQALVQPNKQTSDDVIEIDEDEPLKMEVKIEDLVKNEKTDVFRILSPAVA